MQNSLHFRFNPQFQPCNEFWRSHSQGNDCPCLAASILACLQETQTLLIQTATRSRSVLALNGRIRHCSLPREMTEIEPLRSTRGRRPLPGAAGRGKALIAARPVP
jgi:hypothetical protein